MINWNARKYTKEEFIDAWNTSLSIAEVARKLNCNKTGGGYYTLKTTAKELDLSKDHMTGQGWSKGTNTVTNPGKPLEFYLVKDKLVPSHGLKLKLIKENIFEYKCSGCGLNEWNNPFTNKLVKIPLSLDHINGDHLDNRLENLRLLCYNCHGLTETWGKRKDINKYKKQRISKATPRTNICVTCNSPSVGKQCRQCFNSDKRIKTIQYPPINIIIEMLKQFNYTKAAQKIGCTDNSIRKYLRRNGINPKTFEPLAGS